MSRRGGCRSRGRMPESERQARLDTTLVRWRRFDPGSSPSASCTISYAKIRSSTILNSAVERPMRPCRRSQGSPITRWVTPSLPTSKDDAGVDAPEAESVGDRMLDGHAPGLAGHDVDALGSRVRIVEIERGRCYLVP